MRLVHEATELVGGAVEVIGRKQAHAVVTPAKRPRELGHGHDFQKGDAELREPRQLASRRRERALLRERADVHFVDDLAHRRGAAPVTIPPSIGRRIHDLGGPVRSFGLQAGCGIREGAASVEAVLVARAGARLRDQRRVVTARLAGQGRRVPIGDDLELMLGCPDPEVNPSSALRFCSDRESSMAHESRELTRTGVSRFPVRKARNVRRRPPTTSPQTHCATGRSTPRVDPTKLVPGELEAGARELALLTPKCL